jgi:hypothetical protein
MQTYGWTDGQTDMMKLIVSLCISLVELKKSAYDYTVVE